MKIVLLVFFVLGGRYANDYSPKEITLYGKVVKIVDGDTYDILLNNNTTRRIRMEGIDAPEKKMPFYKVAKDHLGILCFGKMVRIMQSSTDRNGRSIAKTYLSNGSEIGLLMIEAGYAWHFKKYSSDLQLAKAEIKAKNNRVGLWVDENPVAPWDWRKNQSQHKQQIPVQGVGK